MQKTTFVIIAIILLSDFFLHAEDDWIIEKRKQTDFLITEKQIKSQDPLMMQNALNALRQETESKQSTMSTEEIAYFASTLAEYSLKAGDTQLLQNTVTLIKKMGGQRAHDTAATILKNHTKKSEVIIYFLPLIKENLTNEDVKIIADLIKHYGAIQPSASVFSFIQNQIEGPCKTKTEYFKDSSLLQALSMSLDAGFPESINKKTYYLLEGILYGNW